MKIVDLERWLHSSLGRRDKFLVVLASFETPRQVRDIEKRANEAGFRVPGEWNISSLLSRSKGLAVKNNDGWKITSSGKRRLSELGVNSIGSAAAGVTTDRRNEFKEIGNGEALAFANEAIGCLEAKLYRSAIVMSWICAMDLLYRHVCREKLADFNKEAQRVDNKWRLAKNPDDLGKMKDSDFLDRIEALSVIGKDVKKKLKSCLDLRNSCGHPNSLEIGPNVVAAHIELLLLNVFRKIQ